MAVVNATIKTQLENRIAALGTIQDTSKLSAFAQALADFITADLLPTVTVSTTVAVTSVSGVTTGGGVSGPGTGAGTGTVS